MITFAFEISKNYALDIMLFHMVREFKDGIIFFENRLNLDLFKGDHNPQFNFGVVILNFMLIEIDIYNIHHEKIIDATEKLC